jgi:hypothetical protein
MMMSEIEQAEGIVANLQKKREALVARGVELGEQRMKLAFGAHTGDEAARKKLDAINREAALQDSELRSLDAAVAEALKRADAAHQAEARKQEQERARAVWNLAARMCERGPVIDAALGTFVEQTEGAAARPRRNPRLGLGVPASRTG